jgi:hypothetical protein
LYTEVGGQVPESVASNENQIRSQIPGNWVEVYYLELGVETRSLERATWYFVAVEKEQYW